MLLSFNFNAEPGPAVHSNADPDPGPASQNHADPDSDPQPCKEELTGCWIICVEASLVAGTFFVEAEG
jgi:hypothetical protein